MQSVRTPLSRRGSGVRLGNRERPDLRGRASAIINEPSLCLIGLIYRDSLARRGLSATGKLARRRAGADGFPREEPGVYQNSGGPRVSRKQGTVRVQVVWILFSMREICICGLSIRPRLARCAASLQRICRGCCCRVRFCDGDSGFWVIGGTQ